MTSTTEYKYALVQGRYTGKWSFPKGHSNYGETPLECTLREVSEETGLDELPEPTIYLQVGYGKYFLFDLDAEFLLTPRDTNEIISSRWVTIDEMRQLSLNADVSYYLKNILSH
jgi:8-oxo-dGTP diphosphatase